MITSLEMVGHCFVWLHTKLIMNFDGCSQICDKRTLSFSTFLSPFALPAVARLSSIPRTHLPRLAKRDNWGRVRPYTKRASIPRLAKRDDQGRLRPLTKRASIQASSAFGGSRLCERASKRNNKKNPTVLQSS